MIHIGRGSIVVEYPTRDLMSGLSRFRHGVNGQGEYEELYTLSERHHSLVTMPGFADRIIQLCPDEGIKDERIPMPKPDVEKAIDGVDEVWHGVIKDALAKGGGVVSIPEIFGIVGFASAIAMAFPRDVLAERGTPLTVIAARDSEDARQIAFGMRKVLPERKIGISECCSDDIVVAPYGITEKYSAKDTGVLMCDISYDDQGKALMKRVETVSAFRNAARWGMYATAGGWIPDELDMAAEGLFGPISASVMYEDAVKANVAAPVTVCWLKAPRPNVNWGSAPFNTLSSIAMGEKFIGIVSAIVNRTSGDIGCIVCSDIKTQEEIRNHIDEGIFAFVNKKTSVKDARIIFDDIATGGRPKAFVTWDRFPPETSQGVMVSATCGGSEFAGMKFPWRAFNSGKVYIVDFTHDWDFHNGRPGVLARNDAARKRRYSELGFSQIEVKDVDHLPFIG